MKKFFLVILVSLMWSVSMYAQPLSWSYTVTINSHIILVDTNTVMTINGVQISNGDYIGVFYVNSFGQLNCGGYTQWTGALTHVTAWPEDLGNDGFPIGAEFIWKIWDVSNSSEYLARSEYHDNPAFTSTKFFSPNGTSSLSSLTALTHQLPWTYQNSGSNHTVLLPSDFVATIDGDTIHIGDYIGAFYTDNGMPECGGYIQWLGTTSQVTLWADDTQTGDKDGFADGESFTWKIWDALEDACYIGNPSYMGPPMTSQGNFAINGLSGLQQLEVIIQSPGWNYNVTALNHTILIPLGGSYLINDTAIINGDYVGVFYDSSGVEACAGYTIWEGATTYISAFGDDNLTTGKEGFLENESFIWKIWDASEDTIYDANPTYDQSFPNEGNFTSNGQSGLSSLIKLSFILPWNFTISCCNHTILLPINANYIFDNNPLPNGFYLGVFYDSSGTLACAGYTKWEGSTTSITAWGDDSQTIGKEGFADNEEFIWKAWDPNSGNEFFPNVTYIQPPGMPNTNTYFTNGLSGITTVIITNPMVPWEYTNTGNNHSVLIPASAPLEINGSPLEPGDYIGVFYDSLGSLMCCGYSVWEGLNTAVSAWGADLGLDGMALGEAFKWKVWDASADLVFTVYASYDLTFPNQEFYIANGISSLTGLSTTPPFTIHTVEFSQGWGIYSTYVSPFYPSMDSLFSEISTNVDLVKNGDGQVYWPDYFLNQIGNLVQEDGYLVKMKVADTLLVLGDLVDPLNYPFTIGLGWGMIAYLRSSAAPIELMLATIINDIDIVKDGDGNIFWPIFSINFIGDMEPDRGYLIKLSQAHIFNYPAN